MAFVEELTEFLDADDFAVAATYKIATVYVIHEREFFEQHGVQTSAPTALGRKSDFAAVVQGETITIGATTFTVQEFRHDPPGFPDWTLILLGT